MTRDVEETNVEDTARNAAPAENDGSISVPITGTAWPTTGKADDGDPRPRCTNQRKGAGLLFVPVEGRARPTKGKAKRTNQRKGDVVFLVVCHSQDGRGQPEGRPIWYLLPKGECVKCDVCSQRATLAKGPRALVDRQGTESRSRSIGEMP